MGTKCREHHLKSFNRRRRKNKNNLKKKKNDKEYYLLTVFLQENLPSFYFIYFLVHTIWYRYRQIPSTHIQLPAISIKY